MREINNNFDVGNIPKTETKSDKVQVPATESEKSENSKEIKDFSNPTEILGRSQVNKSDNLKQDVSFLTENSDVVESANKFFDIAYAQLVNEKDPDAYEKAATMSSIYAKEITNKSF